jgi:hypothetical protein
MSSAIALRDGYKFAVLAVSRLRASGLPANLVNAPPYAISTSLPAGALDTWQDDKRGAAAQLVRQVVG